MNEFLPEALLQATGNVTSDLTPSHWQMTRNQTSYPRLMQTANLEGGSSANIANSVIPMLHLLYIFFAYVTYFTYVP